MISNLLLEAQRCRLESLVAESDLCITHNPLQDPTEVVCQHCHTAPLWKAWNRCSGQFLPDVSATFRFQINENSTLQHNTRQVLLVQERPQCLPMSPWDCAVNQTGNAAESSTGASAYVKLPSLSQAAWEKRFLKDPDVGERKEKG